ncbi:DUF2939 domain-containing protein [Acinetobacter soli]|nr:DUF2939 domain-containing protein [Acinetobacter soli]
MKTLKYLLILLVLVILGYVVASPYWVVYQIQNAVQKNDAQTLSRYIDFPSVQTHLKERIHIRLGDLQDQQNGPANALGALVASSLMDRLVEVALTPEGMILLLQGKALKERFERSYLEQNLNQDMYSNPESDAPKATTAEEQPAMRYSGHYEAWNAFEVTLQTQQDKEVQFILHRSGWSWKLVDIKIPF